MADGEIRHTVGVEIGCRNRKSSVRRSNSGSLAECAVASAFEQNQVAGAADCQVEFAIAIRPGSDPQ
jgi:hypothetical protein